MHTRLLVLLATLFAFGCDEPPIENTSGLDACWDPDRIGVHVGAENPLADDRVGSLAEIGGGWVRVLYQVPENVNVLARNQDGVEGEQARERFDMHLASFNARLTALTTRGFKTLVVVNRWSLVDATYCGTNECTVPAKGHPLFDPSDVDEDEYERRYLAELTAVTASASANVDAWQLGNEPNMPGRPQRMDCAYFGRLLRAGIPIVEANDETARVISGGVVSFAPAFEEGRDCLFDATEAGSLNLDGIGVHYYGDLADANHATDRLAANWRAILGKVASPRESMGGGRFWITETGGSVNAAEANDDDREAYKSASYLATLNTLGPRDDIARVFFYRLRSQTERLGLIDIDPETSVATQTDAFTILKDAITCSGPIDPPPMMDECNLNARDERWCPCPSAGGWFRDDVEPASPQSEASICRGETEPPMDECRSTPGGMRWCPCPDTDDWYSPDAEAGTADTEAERCDDTPASMPMCSEGGDERVWCRCPDGGDDAAWYHRDAAEGSPHSEAVVCMDTPPDPDPDPECRTTDGETWCPCPDGDAWYRDGVPEDSPSSRANACGDVPAPITDTLIVNVNASQPAHPPSMRVFAGASESELTLLSTSAGGHTVPRIESGAPHDVTFALPAGLSTALVRVELVDGGDTNADLVVTSVNIRGTMLGSASGLAYGHWNDGCEDGVRVTPATLACSPARIDFWR